MAKQDVDAARQRRALQQQRQSGRTRWIVHLLLMIIASAIVVDALVGERGLVAMLRARQEYDQLSASIARQRAENARLRENVRRLHEDPAAIEEIARRELGLIRPGEKLFIVKDVPPASQNVPPSASTRPTLPAPQR